MTEELNLDRLEELLETLEPAQIRSQYAQQLGKNPACNDMLKMFEDLDEDLVQLKMADPAPVIRTRRRPRFPMHWALPLAAGLMVAFLASMKLLSPLMENADSVTQLDKTSVDERLHEPRRALTGADEDMAAASPSDDYEPEAELEQQAPLKKRKPERPVPASMIQEEEENRSFADVESKPETEVVTPAQPRTDGNGVVVSASEEMAPAEKLASKKEGKRDLKDKAALPKERKKVSKQTKTDSGQGTSARFEAGKSSADQAQRQKVEAVTKQEQHTRAEGAAAGERSENVVLGESKDVANINTLKEEVVSSGVLDQAQSSERVARNSQRVEDDNIAFDSLASRNRPEPAAASAPAAGRKLEAAGLSDGLVSGSLASQSDMQTWLKLFRDKKKPLADMFHSVATIHWPLATNPAQYPPLSLQLIRWEQAGYFRVRWTETGSAAPRSGFLAIYLDSRGLCFRLEPVE